MSHYAKIENGVVTNVIVAEQDFINYMRAQDPTAQWVQTSYNTRGGVHYDPDTNQPSADQNKALRKNYAGIGYLYNSELDAFIPPKPYPSWTLNTQTAQWDPPVPIPSDRNVTKRYDWNEQEQRWIELPPIGPNIS